VAVCDPRSFRLAKVGNQSNIGEGLRFSDWKSLATLGEKIADAVVIAILDGEHADCVQAFAELGYAILCEKVRIYGSLSGRTVTDRPPVLALAYGHLYRRLYLYHKIR
jgi:hypothetical protein